MSSLHVKFMDSIIDQPMYVIRKELQKGQRLKDDVYDVDNLEDHIPPFVFEVEEETLGIVHGEKKTGFRVYVLANDSKAYHALGYIASHEIEECMLCKKGFGFLVHKHHCRSCGLVLCQACRPSKVIIDEIDFLGPQRVCDFCFYGQDVVNCQRTLKKQIIAPPPPIINNNAARQPSILATNVGVNNSHNSSSNNMNSIPINNNNNSSNNIRSSFVAPSGNVGVSPEGTVSSGISSSPSLHKVFNNDIVINGNSNNSNNNSNNSNSNSNSNSSIVGMSVLSNSLSGTESAISAAPQSSVTGDKQKSKPNFASLAMTANSMIKAANKIAVSVEASNQAGRRTSFDSVGPATPTYDANTAVRSSEPLLHSNQSPQDNVNKRQVDIKVSNSNSDVPNSNSNSIPNLNASTIERISSKMTEFRLITPTPSLVLKTKKISQNYSNPSVSLNKPSENKIAELPDGSKIFINITTDSSLPYTHEETMDLKKIVGLVCGPFRVTVDKKGDMSGVVDVVVHPDELQVSLLDSSGECRSRMFDQILTLLQIMHSVEIENQLKVLTLNGNYKSSDDFGGSISKIAVPLSTSDFYYKKQIFTFPTDIDKSTLCAAAPPRPASLAITRSNPNPSPQNALDLPPTASVASSKSRPSLVRSSSIAPTGMSFRRPSQLMAAEKEVVADEPMALCVVKSKRGGGDNNDEDEASTKVFINVYYHDAVPMTYAVDPDLCVVPGLLNGSYDSESSSFVGTSNQLAVYASGFTDFQDKNGSIISIGNVILNTEAVGAVENLTSDDPTTEKLIRHIIVVLNYFLKDNIDVDNFSLPKVKNNYKGEKLESARFHVKVLTMVSADLELRVIPRSDQISRMLVKSHMGAEDSDAGAKDKEVAKMADFGLYSPIPIEAGLIKPKAGIVFQATLPSGKLLYVNLCHSEACIYSLADYLIDYHHSDLVLQSIVMGKVDINAVYRGVRSATIDFVIPTEIFEQVKPANPAGTIISVANPQTAVEFLFETLKNFMCEELFIPLTNNVMIIRDEYVGNNFVDGELYPMFNLSIANYNTYQVFIKGAFSKRGSTGPTSWKKRLVEVSHGQIRYYEPSSKDLKGQFDLERHVEVSVVHNNAPIGAPEGSFSLIIRGGENGDPAKFDDFYLACASEIDRASWRDLLNAYSKLSLNTSFLVKYPDIRIGWLSQQGGFIKSWHKRYFVLERGVLSYYEKDSFGTEFKKLPGKSSGLMITDNNLYRLVMDWTESGVQSGMQSSNYIPAPNQVHAIKDKKGHLILRGAIIDYTPGEAKFTIKNALSDFNNKKNMNIEGEDAKDVEIWVDHIRRHVAWVEGPDAGAGGGVSDDK